MAAITTNTIINVTSVADLAADGYQIASGFTLTLNVTAANVTYGQVISGAGNLVKTGVGDLTLTEENTFTGTATISDGSITATANNVLGTGELTIDGADRIQADTNSSVTYGNSSVAIETNTTFGLGNGMMTFSGPVTYGAALTTTFAFNNHTIDANTAPDVIFANGLDFGGFDQLLFSDNRTFHLRVLGNVTNAVDIQLSSHNNESVFEVFPSDTVTAPDLATTGNLSGSNFGRYSLYCTVNSGTYTGNISGHNTTLAPQSDQTFSGRLLGRSTFGTNRFGGEGIITLSGDNEFAHAQLLSGSRVEFVNVQSMGADNSFVNVNQINGRGTIIISEDLIVPGNHGILPTDITFQIADTKTLTVNGNVTGNGILRKSGDGKLELDGAANTSSGDLFVTDGELEINNSWSSQANDLSISSGATLNLGTDITSPSLTGEGNIDIDSGSTLTIDSAQSVPSLFSGIISGAGNLTKLGAGNLTLSGANTLTGVTTNSGSTGSLILDGGSLAGNLAATNNSLFLGQGTNPSVAGDVTLTSASLSSGGTGLSIGGSLTSTGSGAAVLIGVSPTSMSTLAITGAATFTDTAFSTILNSPAVGELYINEDKTLITSSSFTGSTSSHTVQRNTGVPASVGVVLSSTATNLIGTISGAYENISTDTIVNVTTSSDLNATGYIVNTGSTLTLNTTGSSVDVAYSGMITGAGNLTKTGEGSILMHSNLSGFTGDLNINGGILQLGRTSGQGGFITSSPNSVTVGSSGELVMNRATLTTSLINNGTFNIASSNLANSISGDLTLNPSGTFEYNDIQNAVFTVGGNISIGGTFNGNFDLPQQAHDGTVVTGTIINGTPGTGKTLSGSFSTINITENDSLPISASSVTLDQTNFDVIASGTVDNVINIDVDTELTTLSATHHYNVAADATLTLNSDTDLTFTNTIFGFGNLTKQGSGTLTSTNHLLYTGSTSIEGGSITMGPARQLSSHVVAIDSGAVLRIANDETFTSLTGSGTLDIPQHTQSILTLTLNTPNDTIFSGNITETATSNTLLVKSGNGKLTLNGNINLGTDNGIQVVGGELVVNGTYQANLLTVQSNGTLSGTGTINSGLFNSGTLKLVNNQEPLKVSGNLLLFNNGTVSADFDNDSVGRVNVTGNITLGGNVTLTATPGTYTNRRLTMIEGVGSGSLTNEFTTHTLTNESVLGTSTADLEYNELHRDVFLDISAAPQAVTPGGTVINNGGEIRVFVENDPIEVSITNDPITVSVPTETIEVTVSNARGPQGEPGIPGPAGVGGVLEYSNAADQSYAEDAIVWRTVSGTTRIYRAKRTITTVLNAVVANQPSDESNDNWEVISAEGGAGEPGPQGEQGTPGLVGPQGERGLKGDLGPQGESGVPGLSVTGPQGDQGIQGNEGPQGERGIQGEVGPQGERGLQPIITVYAYTRDASVASLPATATRSTYRKDLGTLLADTIPTPYSAFIPSGTGTVYFIETTVDLGSTNADEIQAGFWSGALIYTGATGDNGPQGPAGESIRGEPGPQGEQGIQGLVGPQGIAGQGLDGPQGERGVQGEPGPQGELGNQGIPGAQGEKGDQGNVGPQGDVGSQGIPGAQGEKGIQGNDGPQGERGGQGIPGAQGEKGMQGVVGPQGDKGDQGIPGAQGEKGDRGVDGPQGEFGLQGIPGAQGEKGIQGNDGPMGEQGNQGIPGAQGEKGEVGEPGPQGEAGQGIAGPQGERGLTGVTGPQGDTGATGISGPQGESGPIGFIGPQGESGTSGSIGPQGEKGIQGVVGPAGELGEQGIFQWSTTDTYNTNNIVYRLEKLYRADRDAPVNTDPNVSTNDYVAAVDGTARTIQLTPAFGGLTKDANTTWTLTLNGQILISLNSLSTSGTNFVETNRVFDNLEAIIDGTDTLVPAAQFLRASTTTLVKDTSGDFVSFRITYIPQNATDTWTLVDLPSGGSTVGSDLVYTASQITAGSVAVPASGYWTVLDLTGSAGAVGPQGERGLTGQGETGPQGERGIQGLVGPQGERGLRGDLGPQGEAGVPAPDGAITEWNSTRTYSADDIVIDQTSGSDYVFYKAFGSNTNTRPINNLGQTDDGKESVTFDFNAITIPSGSFIVHLHVPNTSGTTTTISRTFSTNRSASQVAFQFFSNGSTNLSNLITGATATQTGNSVTLTYDTPGNIAGVASVTDTRTDIDNNVVVTQLNGALWEDLSVASESNPTLYTNVIIGGEAQDAVDIGTTISIPNDPGSVYTRTGAIPYRYLSTTDNYIRIFATDGSSERLYQGTTTNIGTLIYTKTY